MRGRLPSSPAEAGEHMEDMAQSQVAAWVFLEHCHIPGFLPCTAQRQPGDWPVTPSPVTAVRDPRSVGAPWSTAEYKREGPAAFCRNLERARNHTQMRRALQG